MAQLTPEQIEAIADKTVADERRDIWKTTWKTRAQALWAGGGLGIVFGAAIGLLAAAAAIIVAPAAGLAILPTVVGAFTVGGMLMGVAACTDAASNVGAELGGMKVEERKRLLKNPDEVLEENAAYRKLARERGQYKDHPVPLGKGSTKMFDARSGLIFAAAGLALGGLLVATGGMGIIAGVLPFITSAFVAHGAAASVGTAVAAMTLTAGAAFGLTFGVDFPTLTSNAVEFVSKMFTGFRSNDAPETAAAVTPQRATALTPEEAAVLAERQGAREKNFTQTIAAQQLQTASANLTPGA